MKLSHNSPPQIKTTNCVFSRYESTTEETHDFPLLISNQQSVFPISMLSVSCTRLSKTSDAQLNHSSRQNSNSGDGIFTSFHYKITHITATTSSFQTTRSPVKSSARKTCYHIYLLNINLLACIFNSLQQPNISEVVLIIKTTALTDF